VKIEIVDEQTIEKVLPLIADYQRFYDVVPDEAKNRAYFSRYLHDHSQGILFVALEDDGSAIGFSTLYFVPSSLSAQTVCTFNDLYLIPSVRERGVALMLGFRALIYARERGHLNVSWLTHPENKIAQRIYEVLPTKRSEWYLYDLSLLGHEFGGPPGE
jgi:GNAT superfamily N-acetyltransferase